MNSLGERSAERHNVTPSAKLASGFDLIYSHISGKPVKLSNSTAATDIPDIEQLESWAIENESILGARLLRDNKGGERIGNNQLIALHTKDATAFMLGTVSWRNVTRSGQLKMGVQYLPGVAELVTLKIKNASSTKGKYISALLLPAMPALKIPGSLIMPRDVFQANLLCELIQASKEDLKIRMRFSVAGGADFERVSFTQE